MQPRCAGTGPDFSSLERHLIKITSQIEALQRPDDIEQSIAAFRSELAEIRPAITEAMPRRAIESIENEIRSLSRRIDDTRQSGTDGQALAGIERALSEIREALRSLTPAEQLAGYDEAIRNLGAKLDLILRANDDPSTVHQLEGAIAALRAIVSNVASNDALARLSDDVQMLSSKVDQLARSERQQRCVRDARTAHRRAELVAGERASARRPAQRKCGTYRERAARAVRPHRPHAGRQRQRVRLRPSRTARVLSARTHRDPTDPRGSRAGNLGRVEDALQDILRHLESQQANLAALAETSRIAARHRSRRWIRPSSTWSSANCPTSASASRKPTAAPRTRWKPFTTRSAMWSIASP